MTLKHLNLSLASIVMDLVKQHRPLVRVVVVKVLDPLPLGSLQFPGCGRVVETLLASVASTTTCRYSLFSDGQHQKHSARGCNHPQPAKGSVECGVARQSMPSARHSFNPQHGNLLVETELVLELDVPHALGQQVGPVRECTY